jgi:guanylate kinase
LRVVESGRNLLLEIEVEGAMNIKRQYPEAVLIMLLPPSFSEQERRLRSRGTETDEVIAGRLKQTYEEMKFFDRYDYFVVNETVDKCADDIQDIVHAEKWAIKRHLEFPKTYFEG